VFGPLSCSLVQRKPFLPFRRKATRPAVGPPGFPRFPRSITHSSTLPLLTLSLLLTLLSLTRPAATFFLRTATATSYSILFYPILFPSSLLRLLLRHLVLPLCNSTSPFLRADADYHHDADNKEDINQYINNYVDEKALPTRPTESPNPLSPTRAHSRCINRLHQRLHSSRSASLLQYSRPRPPSRRPYSPTPSSPSHRDPATRRDPTTHCARDP
jgi:hypothetical protein